MKLIDKTVLEAEAEAIVAGFLKDLKEGETAYPKDLYNAFKSARNEEGLFLKDLLIALLLKEQHNCCCYCMRRLDAGEEKTVEHLIPNKGIDRSKFDKYLNPNTVLNDKKVCYAEEFINNQETVCPPFPHTIAYQNLTISCNGKFSKSDSITHCNLHRGEKYVEPFILNDSIVEQIEYKPDGFVIWKADPNEIPSLNRLGLNNERLKMTRRIWFYANKRGCDLSKLNASQKNEFLYKLLENIPENESEVLLNFTKDHYWQIVVEKYDYFALPK
jgi:hypothetical protein